MPDFTTNKNSNKSSNSRLLQDNFVHTFFKTSNFMLGLFQSTSCFFNIHPVFSYQQTNLAPHLPRFFGGFLGLAPPLSCLRDLWQHQRQGENGHPQDLTSKRSFRGFPTWITLPETNIATENRPWKRRFLVEPSFLRARLVSGRVTVK